MLISALLYRMAHFKQMHFAINILRNTSELLRSPCSQLNLSIYKRFVLIDLCLVKNAVAACMFAV